jgi:hypothetical protein
VKREETVDLMRLKEVSDLLLRSSLPKKRGNNRPSSRTLHLICISKVIRNKHKRRHKERISFKEMRFRVKKSRK